MTEISWACSPREKHSALVGNEVVQSPSNHQILLQTVLCQCCVSTGLGKRVTYSLSQVDEINSAEVELISGEYHDEQIEPHAGLSLLVSKMWRIPQVVVHKESVYSMKFF